MAKKNEKSGWQRGLKKVGDVYHYRFMAQGKVWKGSTGTSSFAEAKEFLRRVKDQQAMAKVGVLAVPTLEALIGHWKQVRGPLVSANHLAKPDQIRPYIQSILQVPIDKITTSMIEDIKAAYMQSGRTWRNVGFRPHRVGGLNDMLKVLKAVLNFGVEAGYVDHLGCRIKREKVRKVARPYVGADQTRAFLDVVDQIGKPVHRMLIRLMLGLGLREIEARHARWEWVDWTASTYTPGFTKGGEATPLPMPKWLAAYLHAHRDPLRIQGLICGRGPLHAPFSNGITAPVIRRAGAAVGVSGLSPHRMRTSFVTQLAQTGADLRTIQALGRHRDITTSALYMELGNNSMRKAIENRDAQIMGGPREGPEPR